MNQKERATKIAQIVQEALSKHPEIGEATPVMYNPFTMEPTVGIMVDTDNGQRLGLRVNIEDLSPEMIKLRNEVNA